MENPKFIIGNEKRFGEFISSLAEAKRIIVISHIDLDGLASAKVVEHALEIDKVYLIDYIEFTDEFIENLKKEKPSHVIITDHLMKNDTIVKKIEKFSRVLVIDHHMPEADLNSGKTIFLNAQGICATYICYFLFSKIKDLNKIDWIVACACISDFLDKEVNEFMTEVFEKYGEKYYPNYIRRGKFWEIVSNISMSLIYFSKNRTKVYEEIGSEFGELGNLNKYVAIIQKEIDKCMQRFKKEKIKISDCYYWEFFAKYPVKSWVINEISIGEIDKTFILGEVRGKDLVISARRQDGKVNVRDLLKKLIEGFKEAEAGGHFRAAGAHILLKNKKEFKKRVKNI